MRRGFSGGPRLWPCRRGSPLGGVGVIGDLLIQECLGEAVLVQDAAIEIDVYGLVGRIEHDGKSMEDF